MKTACYYRRISGVIGFLMWKNRYLNNKREIIQRSEVWAEN
ncbi:hypothetical protein CSB69_0111 [Morganella morganii]|nr:hypothetical protein CSB69_0111 [Morganella morganii]